MPTAPESQSRTEQAYLAKAKPFALKLAIGLFLLFIIIPPIIYLSLWIQALVLLVIFILVFVIYFTAIPILLHNSRRYGLGLWMDSNIILYQSTVGYIGAFGMMISLIIIGAYPLYTFGFNISVLIEMISLVIVMLLSMLGIYILTNYQKKQNLHKRSLWLREDIHTADDGFHKALASLNLKISKIWIGSKLTGYPVRQINDYHIHYAINRQWGITTIELNPTKPEFLPKMADIERAVSGQFGFKSPSAEKTAINQ